MLQMKYNLESNVLENLIHNLVENNITPSLSLFFLFKKVYLSTVEERFEERPTIKENSKSNVVLQLENVGGLVHENVIDVLTPSKYLFSSNRANPWPVITRGINVGHSKSDCFGVDLIRITCEQVPESSCRSLFRACSTRDTTTGISVKVETLRRLIKSLSPSSFHPVHLSKFHLRINLFFFNLSTRISPR